MSLMCYDAKRVHEIEDGYKATIAALEALDAPESAKKEVNDAV